MILARLTLLILFTFIFSCNSNKSDEEMEGLWSKAQTRNEIIERSGTVFNSGIDMDLAMRDAETRLQTGGGLLGKDVISMAVNPFLWQGTLDTINFMPLNSADQIGGTIITDWYSTTENPKERCKLNVFITGKKLNTENLKVKSFCQEFKDQTWVNKFVDQENNIKIENAILNKAKKLKLQSS